MTDKQLPSPEVLRKIMRYEPETGKLFWIERPLSMFADTGYGGQAASAARWNCRFAGKEAMIAKKIGGFYGRIFGQKILAHRAIWAMQTDNWPNHLIDHINGNSFDNVWSNLREATYAQNAWNTGMRKNNSSGYKGVSQRGKSGQWFARIQATYGPFDSSDEACKAYDFASDYLYGEFKRSLD